MRISEFELRVVEVPLRLPVEHAIASRSVASNVWVGARSGDGLWGWGECCPRPYVTGETTESAVQALESDLLPHFLGREFDDWQSLAEALLGKLDTLPRHRQAAFCTLELALLDLAGHSFGASAGRVLGPVLQPEVRYSAVIAASAPETAVGLAHRARQAGFAEVKIKVGPHLEDNLRLLAAVREVLGADAALRVDANCAWSTDEALRQLRAFGEFSLCGVEQPVAADDLDGLRALTQAGLVPVVVDESLASMGDARRLIEQQACNVFNLRVSKCGGLLNTGRLHRLARENGLACQLGAQVGETGLLSAAGRHVATRCQDLLWLEGSFDALLLQAQLTRPDITFGQAGRAPALRGPGLGVAPLSDQLSRHTVDRRRLSI